MIIIKKAPLCLNILKQTYSTGLMVRDTLEIFRCESGGKFGWNVCETWLPLLGEGKRSTRANERRLLESKMTVHYFLTELIFSTGSQSSILP